MNESCFKRIEIKIKIKITEINTGIQRFPARVESEREEKMKILEQLKPTP